tara:strand:+ start:679 stop:879 length:201 start_codon:yes stop_codon:yes gene_type:complete
MKYFPDSRKDEEELTYFTLAQCWKRVCQTVCGRNSRSAMRLLNTSVFIRGMDGPLLVATADAEIGQ